MSDELLGKVLGRYRIVEDLGSGGMTSVYKAINEDSGRTMAVKVLPSHLTRKPEYIRRFRREYKVMANLAHPNLVAIHEYDCTDGVHYYSMPFVAAPTLDRVMEAAPGRRLPPLRVARIGVGLLSALEYIHEAGIIHRDLKPVNLFVEEGDHVLLADFGLAKAMRQTVITMQPTFMGTVEYASPEQIDVSATVDPRSDLYQTGLLLFQAAAGALPFPRRDIETMINEKCFKEGLAAVRTLEPSVPEGLDRVIQRATRTDPGERWQDARQMREALEALLTSGELGAEEAR